MRLNNFQIGVLYLITLLILFSATCLSTADKVRVAYVSPSVSQLCLGSPELGILLPARLKLGVLGGR